MEPYNEVVWSLERAHYAFLGMIRHQLDREQIRDTNNVQAMMLFYIGDGELSIGELTRRGCYLGSNVSYNVKKLIEHQYLIKRRSELDRRSVYLKLSRKGRDLRDHLKNLFDQQSKLLDTEPEGRIDSEAAAKTLRHLDKFWDRIGGGSAGRGS